MRHRLGLAAAFATVLAAVLLVVSPAVAWAQGEEGPKSSYDLVRQAIALIVNQPDDMDSITGKIDEALASADPADVQLPLVQQAKNTMASGDLHRVRALLEKSIGARVHTDTTDPVTIGEPARAVGTDTATVATLGSLPGRDGLTGTDWIMLGLSIAAGVGGLALSFRLRPRHLPRPGPTREVSQP